MDTNPLVGTWRLVSCEVRSAAGEVSYPWGSDAVGYLLYTADGHVAVNLMSTGRPHFSGEDITGGTVAEKVLAAETYVAYCGTYEVRGDTVLHRIEVSFFPNWIGEQERLIELDGDRLTISTRPLPVDEREQTFRLVWERQDTR